MPVHYKIQAKLVEFRLTGAFSLDELEEVCNRAILNPAFKSPMKVIIDATQALTGSTSSEIKALAVVLRAIMMHMSSKWAILANPGSLNFGLARMLAAHIGQDDIETCVFPDRRHACRWLFKADIAANKQHHCAFPPLSEFKGWKPYP